MDGEIKLAIVDNQISWERILEHANENGWNELQKKKYYEGYECGEYISEERDGRIIQHIRIIKLEINHSIGGVNHLLLHTPTSTLMKHKLPGGKQSKIDRELGTQNNRSLSDSFTALREAVEELRSHSPQISVYVAHENRLVSYESGKFVTQSEIASFPCLILENKSHEESGPNELVESRYPGVLQSRTDVFVRGEIHSLPDSVLQTIEHPPEDPREVFRWVPMTDDIVNWLQHRRLVSTDFKNSCTSYKTKGSLPIYATHSQSLLDTEFFANANKRTISPTSKRDISEPEAIVKRVKKQGKLIDTPFPSREFTASIPYEMGKNLESGNIRFRYQNKSRSELDAIANRVAYLLSWVERKDQNHSDIIDPDKKTTHGFHLISEQFSNVNSQSTLGSLPDCLSQKYSIFRQNKSMDTKERSKYNNILSIYANAFFAMNQRSCEKCGVEPGVPCNSNNLGIFLSGKKNRGLLIPSDGELVPQFSEKVLNEGATNLQKEYPDIVAELNHVVQQVSKLEHMAEYVAFKITKKVGEKLKYVRPFSCDFRLKKQVGTMDVDLLKSMAFPQSRNKKGKTKSGTRGSRFYLPKNTAPNTILQFSFFNYLRRLLIRFLTTKWKDWLKKPGYDRVFGYDNHRLMLEFISPYEASYQTIPIDSEIKPNEPAVELPFLEFEKLESPRTRFTQSDIAKGVMYKLVKSEKKGVWNSEQLKEIYPVLSIECSFDEFLSAAFMHGEGVVVSIDLWSVNYREDIDYILSEEDRIWGFNSDIFSDEAVGSRTFSSFLTTLTKNNLLDVENEHVNHERRILGVISLDELIRVRRILRKEDRFY